MKAESRYAVGQVVFAGRAQVAVVRPAGDVLAMTLLSYESEMKKPEDFEDEVKRGRCLVGGTQTRRNADRGRDSERL